MNHVASVDGVPAEAELDGVPTRAHLAEELARQERSERWLLARQVALVLTLVVLLLTHVLLS